MDLYTNADAPLADACEMHAAEPSSLTPQQVARIEAQKRIAMAKRASKRTMPAKEYPERQQPAEPPFGTATATAPVEEGESPAQAKIRRLRERVLIKAAAAGA